MERSTGLLAIRTYSASEAIPIEGVNVIIRGNDDVSRDSIYMLSTDIDGVTKHINLPTPSVNYSLSPNPKESPYSTYSIIAYKDGYQDKIIENVAIFQDTSAILPINMIPTNSMKNPLGNSFVIVTENEALE